MRRLRRQVVSGVARERMCVRLARSSAAACANTATGGERRDNGTLAMIMARARVQALVQVVRARAGRSERLDGHRVRQLDVRLVHVAQRRVRRANARHASRAAHMRTRRPRLCIQYSIAYDMI